MWHSRVGSQSSPPGGLSVEQQMEADQVLKLKECCDMLLAGGYHRARMQALSPFDRVVGGLVWSITASNVEVDVDIIFQENSTIGQKIALSDRIVRALVKMRCPHPLQSHQIQGLDYDHLFPVIQWLVRKVIETRRLTGDLVRAQSISQFSRFYKLPDDFRPPPATEFVQSVESRYRPRRKFRRREGATIADLAVRAEAALLEFGEKLYRASWEDADEEHSKRSASMSQKQSALRAKFEQREQLSQEERQKKEEADKQAAAEAEQKRMDALQGQLDALRQEELSVGDFIDSEAIGLYDAELRRKQEESGALDEEQLGKRGAARAFERQIEGLRRRIAQQEALLKEKREQHAQALATAEQIGKRLEEKSKYRERVVRETAKLDEIEQTHEKRHFLPALRNLVILNESLKKQEALFKASCKQKLEEFQRLMADLDAGGTGDDEESQRMREIERIYQADLAKLNKMRQVLAEKNQEIARIVRAIDDIPTRAELIQYERRFVELYDLVAEKLIETRKYYALYNTLEESHRYMTNEVNLLESVSSQFPTAAKTKSGIDAFLESFKTIIDGVEQSLAQTAKALQGEEASRDMLSDKHKKLLEKQRKYFKAVKEFQEECVRNEQLVAALERATAAAPTAEA